MHPAVVISVVGVSNVAVHKRKLFCFVRLCGLESVLCILAAQNSLALTPMITLICQFSDMYASEIISCKRFLMSFAFLSLKLFNPKLILLPPLPAGGRFPEGRPAGRPVGFLGPPFAGFFFFCFFFLAFLFFVPLRTRLSRGGRR